MAMIDKSTLPNQDDCRDSISGPADPNQSREPGSMVVEVPTTSYNQVREKQSDLRLQRKEDPGPTV